MLREYLASSAPWLPFRRDDLRRLRRQLSADLGERDPPGRPQHPPADDGGDGEPPARRATRWPRWSGCWRRRWRGGVGPLLRALHRARQLRRRRRDPRPRPRPAPPRRRLLRRTCATKPTACFEAVREAIAVAEATGVHVQIAHLKLSGTDNWGGAPRLLAEIAAARRRGPARGLRRLSLRHGHQSAAQPAARAGSWRTASRRCSNGSAPRRAHAHPRRDRARGPHQLRPHPLLGRGARGRLAAPARKRRPHAAATSRAAAASIRSTPSRDYIVADRGETRILITSMADADVHEITRTPWVTRGLGRQRARDRRASPARASRIRATTAPTRAILGPCVRDLRLLTLERRRRQDDGRVRARARPPRSRPAARGRVGGRDRVRPRPRIADRSTYDEPHRYADGRLHGPRQREVVIDGGDHTGALPGRVLRRRPLALS